MMHAHRLVRRPGRRGIHPVGIDLPGREGLPLGHQAGRQPSEDFGGLGGVPQVEAANQNRTVLGDDGAQGIPVLGRPARRVAGGLDRKDGRLARLQVDFQQ